MSRRLLVFSFVAILVLTLLPAAAAAQSQAATVDTQVTGLAVRQDDGSAILSWNPVQDATSYEIERTPLAADDTPAGDPAIVGIWRPDRTQWAPAQPDIPTFADSGFELGGRYQWRVRAVIGVADFPNQVVVDPPSEAEGVYGATGASFGPGLDETGVSGDIALVDDGSANPTQGCGGLVGFPGGSIALADRGGCTFVQKVLNAQTAGAIGVVIANDTGGAPINLGGTSTAVTIPSGMISQADGNTIKAGLPATGTFQAVPGEPFSEPVRDDTLAPFGPEEFLTQFETSGGSQWTTHENEIDFTDRLAEASERVRVETVGHTVLGRRIDLWTFGYPAPLATPEQISRTPTLLISGNVHGNEPAPREATFMLARELAFSDDPWVIDILSNATVLILPTMNGDGRANNTRGNVTGQDLNRDHSLLRQPETFAFAEVMRDYTPDAVLDGHEFGNTNTGDLPLLWPRHRNVAPAIHDGAMSMVRDYYFNRSPLDGWWTVPYPFPSVGAGLGQETILRNTTGLKNMLGMLLETRVPTGPTRPGFSSTENMRRRTYSALWVFREFLNHHREQRGDVYDAVVGGREFNIANEGPVFLNGAYDAPENTPIADPPTRILDPAPCGYQLTMEQYTGEKPDGPTVEQRLGAHGIRTEVHDDAALVRLTQPLRGLIPLLLDAEAVEGMVAGERLDECPPPVCTGNVQLSGHDSGVSDRPVDDNFCLSHLFDDERPWPNHGQFVEHVRRTAGEAQGDGHISSREGSQLVRTAAASWGDGN